MSIAHANKCGKDKKLIDNKIYYGITFEDAMNEPIEKFSIYFLVPKKVDEAKSLCDERLQWTQCAQFHGNVSIYDFIALGGMHKRFFSYYRCNVFRMEDAWNYVRVNMDLNMEALPK